MTLLHDIATALGDTSGVLERAVEQATIADLDFELPCGSEYHDQGQSPDCGGHSGNPHGGPALYFFLTPCGCCDGPRCQPFVDSWNAGPEALGECDDCGSVCLKSECRIIPIGNP